MTVKYATIGTMTSQRITNLYDLMDAAYDAPIVRERSKSLGHVAIIDINTRRNIKLKEELRAEARRCELLHFERPEDRRYKSGQMSRECMLGSRTNLVADDSGPGICQVLAHLMFGILALTADQLMRLVSQPVT